MALPQHTRAVPSGDVCPRQKPVVLVQIALKAFDFAAEGIAPVIPEGRGIDWITCPSVTSSNW
eukprot:1392094-Rhodomonas_salina.8